MTGDRLSYKPFTAKYVSVYGATAKNKNKRKTIKREEVAEHESGLKVIMRHVYCSRDYEDRFAQ